MSDRNNAMPLPRRRVLAAAVLMCSVSAQADLKLSGDIELDTTASKTAQTDTIFDQGGRFQLTATGEHKSGEYFVRGQVQALSQKSSGTATDDMWLQFGGSGWDVKLGRYEAVDLFPLGKDTLVFHAGTGAQVYQANLARGRVGGSSGQIGLHFSPAGGVSFGVDTVYGDQNFSGAGEETFGGIRPYVGFKAGSVGVTVGGEKVKSTDVNGTEVQDKTGLGVTVNLALGDVVVNANAASLKDKSGTTDTEVLTLGANVQAGAFGAGVVASETDNAAGLDPSVTTVYATYTVPLFGIKNATTTFAVNSSSADDAGADDSKSGVRVRFNYTF